MTYYANILNKYHLNEVFENCKKKNNKQTKNSVCSYPSVSENVI